TGLSTVTIDGGSPVQWTNTSTAPWSSLQIGVLNSSTYINYFDEVNVTNTDTTLTKIRDMAGNLTAALPFNRVFDGSTGMITIPNSTDFSWVTTQGLTVSAWIRPDTL